MPPEVRNDPFRQHGFEVRWKSLGRNRRVERFEDGVEGARTIETAKTQAIV
jgi:hypothetical protein